METVGLIFNDHLPWKIAKDQTGRLCFHMKRNQVIPLGKVAPGAGRRAAMKFGMRRRGTKLLYQSLKY